MDLEPRRVSIEREEEWIKIKQNITDATQVYIREYLKENGMESNAVLKAEMEDLIARVSGDRFRRRVQYIQPTNTR